MSQRPEREGILVGVARLGYQGFDKVTAPDIVREVAEEFGGKRVVAHVLDDAAAVSVGISLSQLLFAQTGEALYQERTQIIFPNQIDDRLVGKDRVSVDDIAGTENQNECYGYKRTPQR